MRSEFKKAFRDINDLNTFIAEADDEDTRLSLSDELSRRLANLEFLLEEEFAEQGTAIKRRKL